MNIRRLNELKICFKGAGEMASGIAHRLHTANFHNIVMLEIPKPLAVRRHVSFCQSIYHQKQSVEGITAVLVENSQAISAVWEDKKIAVLVDPKWELLKHMTFDVIIDVILAKKNLGTKKGDAFLVIAAGPGFNAGTDADFVIETNRGHNLGRVITNGYAKENTGIPGNIGGYTAERVFRAPGDGVFASEKNIGDLVKKGDVIGTVGTDRITAAINGVIRGLIMPGLEVRQGLKMGDIDPRGDTTYCATISDKARTIGGSVLETILLKYNT